MIVVRDLLSINQITDNAIRDLVRQRIEDLGGAAFDADVLGYFLVVESGDSLEALSPQIGFDILCNRMTGLRYDQPEFTPSFEFVEAFPSCFELVFILSDDGYGVDVFVPRDSTIDPRLLALCQQYAFKSEGYGEQPAKCQQRASIYVSAHALETVRVVQGMDEGQRDLQARNPQTDLRQREGYYLCSESMRLVALPSSAEVVAVLTPCDIDTYARHVQFPPELRGVVYGGAPQLPQDYATIIGYWSPLTITEQYAGAQHCQNRLNEYAIPEIDGHVCDALLSNAVVVCIEGIASLIPSMATGQYIEIHIPVNADFLGMDREWFDSSADYGTSTVLHNERIYLRVQDVLDSPNPNFIAIAVLHTENYDADFNC